MQIYTSANTSVNKSKVPVLFKKILWIPNTRNVDIGGGKYDTATEYLAMQGVENLIYDPYNRSSENNKEIMLKFFFHMADTSTISNVLNVIKEKENRIDVLKLARRWSKMTYITVYEGNKSGIGKESKKGCWQENRCLNSYVQEVEEIFNRVKIHNHIIIAWKEY